MSRVCYISSSGSGEATLREALFRGLAPDGGLYLPEPLTPLPKSFLQSISSLTFQEIALEIAKALLGGALPAGDLEKIIAESMNFPLPLVSVEEKIWSLELFHGPTLSFKDFGARFMARLFAFLRAGEEKELNILVATSGDTGSAVASGFYNVPSTHVWILYPQGGVSEIQEQQMTTLGGNVTAIAVAGSFDDCQRMVKTAFQDPDLNAKTALTSANSINIGRLIPQIFYYFYGCSRLPKTEEPLAVAVPSGNFGNLTGGLIAKRLGAPIDTFIAATNANDIIPRYLTTGRFEPRPSKSTLSNAMDVGNPSNFARMQALYGSSLNAMREEIVGESFSDEETRAAIAELLRTQGYRLDPHGAVAYLGVKRFLQAHPRYRGIFLETAHPAKFAIDGIEEAEMPERLCLCLTKEKKALTLAADASQLKELLLAAIV